MLRLAYVVSQFPEAHEWFIVREALAMARQPDVSLSIVSLKRARRHVLEGEAARLVERTTYPSPRGDAAGAAGLPSTPGSRRCLRQVLHAYRSRPSTLAKALVTMARALAALPMLRRIGNPHVHAHWATMPALAAYLLHEMAGLRYSVTAHAWDIYTDTTMLREKMDAAEFVVTCTAYNRDHLTRTVGSATPVFLSYHGVDFATLPPPTFGPRSGLTVLAVGRLVEQKGFRHLVEACEILAGSGRPVQCRILGEGPLRESLAHEIQRRRLGGVVALEGARPLAAVFDAYRQSTLLCVPSVVAGDGDRDGIPNVIIEGMSQGIPVVASDVSGIPEIVSDGRTGWLVPPADPAALARAIAEVPDRPQEVASRIAAAHQLVREQFDANRNALALLEHFRSASRS